MAYLTNDQFSPEMLTEEVRLWIMQSESQGHPMPKHEAVAQAEIIAAESSKQTLAPAWLLSLVLHFFLVILLAIGMRAAAGPKDEEPPRRIGIVLAQHDDERRFAYLAESQDSPQETERTEQDSTPASVADAPTAGESGPMGAAVPSSLLIPDIQLPGAATPMGATDELLSHNLNVHAQGRKPILPGMYDDEILVEEAAMRAARRALGPTTDVSLFSSTAAVGRSFVFAIDRSKSMGGEGLNALSAAATELSRALAHLSPKQRFQIIAYHHNCVYYKTPRLVPATDENKPGVPGFIDRLAAFGGTDHEMALRASLGMEPDVVFLLTDGGDPHLNDIQLANIRKLAEGQTTIHCIQFGFGELRDEANFMTRVARQNGGGFTYVNMSGR